MKNTTKGKPNGKTQERNFRNKVHDAAREQRMKEKEEKKAIDFEVLVNICKALDGKVGLVREMKASATGRLTSDQMAFSNITNNTIIDYFNSIVIVYNPSPQVAGLASILIDLARCQVNLKLTDHHKAIRIAYFMDRFQAYFNVEYNNNKKELYRDFNNLFACNIGYIGFQDCTKDAGPSGEDNVSWFDLDEL